MSIKLHHPVQWLEKLSGVLKIVKCKLSDQPVALDQAFLALEQILNETRAKDAALWWVGNGGSAAICSHLSQDVLNKLGIRSMNLNDASLITCMANDFGYSKVYEKPLRTLVRDGDMLIAISSSGNSENILSCARLAKEKNMKLVTLSGFSEDNFLWNVKSDISFYLPVDLYGLVEVGHEALLHSVIECMFLNEHKEKLD
jgi:D-sedoheptulose 7-phosphate isomerase